MAVAVSSSSWQDPDGSREGEARALGQRRWETRMRRGHRSLIGALRRGQHAKSSKDGADSIWSRVQPRHDSGLKTALTGWAHLSVKERGGKGKARRCWADWVGACGWAGLHERRRGEAGAGCE